MILGAWIEPDGRIGWCWAPPTGWWCRPTLGLLPIGGVGALAGVLAGWILDEYSTRPDRIVAGGATTGIDRVAEWWNRPQTRWIVATGEDARTGLTALRYDADELAEATRAALARLDGVEDSPAALAAGLAWWMRITE